MGNFNRFPLVFPMKFEYPKLYEIKYDKTEEEYYVINDEGTQSLIFLVHNGDLIIKP